MKSFALLFLGLMLTVATIGCKKEDSAPAPGAAPTAPAGDADKDGDANATDAAPTTPAAN